MDRGNFGIIVCELCSVVDKKLWSEQGFFGLTCRHCRVPMIVLEAHRVNLTDGERVTLKALQQKYFLKLKARGIGVRSCPNHWHEHYHGNLGA